MSEINFYHTFDVLKYFLPEQNRKIFAKLLIMKILICNSFIFIDISHFKCNSHLLLFKPIPSAEMNLSSSLIF